ncbi:hypothetical protein PAT3040_03222 [Paenibacillus agaridevorans]|uniref:Beta-hexosaminidase bacterial type N-terminal domain-containing protein n=1 Tax=Paenibacillus agaridevorans TaxID=171404 RepID=A0A2R5EZ60_9BACL|nr:hypothetical protein [Paenibacillus agaridevorans]GBG08634.1 hypothetical protein PAT3040_03222 [Paenibacillus agaridevorans]
MMHNSLLIADRLLRANQDEIAIERRAPHRSIRRLAAVDTDSPNVVGLGGSWLVAREASFTGATEAAEDLSDYLSRAGIEVNEHAEQRFVIREDASIGKGCFKREVRSGEVVIEASEAKGLWAGIVWTERELSASGVACLEAGIVERSPQWQVQISQAPYLSNYLVPDLDEAYLSDEAFGLLAHYGINGMTLYGDWLLYVESRIFPELNHPKRKENLEKLQDAARRAAKYGISLYYVPVSPKLDGNHPLFQRVPSARGARINPGLVQNGKEIYNLCSSDPDCLDFHGETMANLFREVPELGGLILIIGGESYYHCFMRPDLRDLPEEARTNCPNCRDKQPEDAVNGLLRATADAVHAVKPDAPIMAWPYSAFVWSSDPAQLALIDGMSNGVSLLSTIEKDEWAVKEGYDKKIWDYSVDYTGPATNLLQQAEDAAGKHIPLYIKTETAIGLECIHIPYMPALGRLEEKWRNTAAMSPAGVLQSWMFFGMWGSRAEELGWWASWRPELPAGEAAAVMAKRDFGPAAEAFMIAWRELDQAVAHLPYIPIYFTGPEFIGPAHPLAFGDLPDEPELYEALLYYLQENEETFSNATNEVKHSLVLTSLPHSHMEFTIRPRNDSEPADILIREYEIACRHALQAYQAVASAPASEDSLQVKMAAEECALIEYVYRTLLTTLNTYKFLLAKESGNKNLMLEIAAKEKENAEAAVPLLARAPWLELSRRTDGEFPSTATMLEAKLRSLANVLGR